MSNYISYEEFRKVDLRVGKVIEAEDVKGSKNLIKLIVDLGEEKKQIITGLKKWYRPEDLKGKYVVVVANLEPKVFMGLESQGMILATIDTDKPIIITVEEEVPPGSRIA